MARRIELNMSSDRGLASALNTIKLGLERTPEVNRSISLHPDDWLRRERLELERAAGPESLSRLSPRQVLGIAPSQKLNSLDAAPVTAVNVAIASVLFGWLVAADLLEPLGRISLTAGPFLERVMLANLALVFFNLIPAFPMDGGRVLRAVLASRMNYARATRIAAGIGQGSAVLFGLLGLFTNPFLVLIAVFVWFGAAQESSAVEMKAGLQGTRVAAAMLTDFQTVSPWDTTGRLVDLVLRGSHTEFAVVEQGRVVGLVSQADLMTALSECKLDCPVFGIMRRDFQVAEIGEQLETVFERMQEQAASTIPIMDRGRLVGLLTLENVAEFFAIRKALGGRFPDFPGLAQRA